MKKIYNVMMLAAVAAAALVSCAKEMDKPEAEQKGEGIQITVVTALPETKTYMVDDNTAGWSAGDKVDFVQSVAGEKVQSEAAVISEGKATFTATVANTGSFYAYYPTSSRALVNNHGEVKVLEEQYPSAADTFDPTADVLVSDYFDVAAAGSTSTDPTVLRFKRLGAFIKLKFVDNTTGNVLGSEHASTIAIQNDGEGAVKLTGKIEVSPEGIGAITRYYYSVTAHYEAGVFDVDDNYAYFGVLPNTLVSGSSLIFTAETEHYRISKTVDLTKDITYASGDILPITVSLTDAELTAKTAAITNLWVKYSEGTTAWNEYYGGTADSDRNIAMDDEYVYIAESSATAKLWAISISDPETVVAVNVEGVTGGAHVLSCPRVLRNTDPAINGGKDILICGNLTRGGVEPKLYFWKDGINNPPTAMTLNTYATGAWYGDTFTVYGSLQNGVLLYDKTGGDGANGVVTFNLSGVIGSNNYLLKRVKFNDAMGSHGGTCAYYPFPGDINHGIYSPGRGVEARGKSAVVTGDFFADGNAAFPVALTNLDYADGRNGYVLAYNFVEWEGKRYVIYGKQESSTVGKVYILEGSSAAEWLTIANTAGVKFRRDLIRQDGCTLVSGNSGMDVTARVINGDLYIAAQKQNIACGVYKISLQ